MDAGCDMFMHSNVFPSWGCRCCKSISGLKKHTYWNVYSNDKNDWIAPEDIKPDPVRPCGRKEEPKKQDDS